MAKHTPVTPRNSADCKGAADQKDPADHRGSSEHRGAALYKGSVQQSSSPSTHATHQISLFGQTPSPEQGGNGYKEGECAPASSSASESVRTDAPTGNGVLGRVPTLPNAQLGFLSAQFERCIELLTQERAALEASFHDQKIGTEERVQLFNRVRKLAWNIRRDILPLIDHVPNWALDKPAYPACARNADRLQLLCNAALRFHSLRHYEREVAQLHASKSRVNQETFRVWTTLAAEHPFE